MPQPLIATSGSHGHTLVVMPTYNERENLPLMAKALFALGLPDFSLLVVDDNSPDGTGRLAEELSAQYDGAIRVLHRPSKAGLGPAYLAGFRHALALGAQRIIQMDADFSHQPHYIPALLAALDEADLVIGSRWIRGGGVDPTWGLHRKLLSMWANRIYTPLILGMPIHDATGGFRAWRRATLEGLDLEQVQSNGYVFQVEIAYIAYRSGYRLRELPIFFPERQRGVSKMSSRVALEAALRVWQIRNRYRGISAARRANAED
ncbi:MAG: polyprenol monophosphomannose synthase [Anaerolineae bacterium]|nr:polyprenol monophosphomannose synthase [Anaerolineae bacterium]MDW8171796.1 polyprenol monophosphomannose synthase [Anaerolineae bacterium]